MVKVVQIVGGSANIMDVYVGPERELGVVTDTHELRIFDGNKIGGFRLLPVDANDLRYMVKNIDLTAIGAITGQIGFLARRASGNFIYRTLTAGSDISVTDGAGVNGNPTVALASTITQAITFNLETAFNGGIIADVTGNVVGNVTGDLTGDSVGTHTGNVDGNVLGDLTGDSMGSHIGGVDVRGETLELDDAQIPAAKVTPLPAVSGADSNTFRTGMIMLWSGSVGSIPSGWQLCDGTNATPDLRDKFVAGAGGTKNPGDEYGASAHNHGVLSAASAGSHTHTITVGNHTLDITELPSIQIGTGIGLSNKDAASAVYGTQAVSGSSASDNIDTGGSAPTLEPLSEIFGGDQAHNHPGSASTDGTHSHNVDTTGASASNLPPTYSLAYIMKL